MENTLADGVTVLNSSKSEAEEVYARKFGHIERNPHLPVVYGLEGMLPRTWQEPFAYTDFLEAFEYDFNYKLGYIFTHAELDAHIAKHEKYMEEHFAE